MSEADPLDELVKLWREVAASGGKIVLPQTVTEQLELRAMAYRAALAAGERILQPSLVDFLGA